MCAAIAAAIACAATAGPASASAPSKEVRYGRYVVQVPSSWPVYDLARHPATCVRFDRHAVYLGEPGAEQRCPAHVVGRSEALLIEPKGAVAPGGGPEEARVEIPSAGVAVTATWRRHRGLVGRILEGAQLRHGGTVTAAPPAPSQAPEQSTSSSAAYQKGLGFDACSAPSRNAMAAWSSSPYEAVGVYIGGANRGCSQPNLTQGWVRRVTSTGWALMPIYVGLQAPGTSCNCATISRREAKSQGRAAARDAISDARALGLGPGSPIYFDMEYYARSSSNSRTALRFLAAWTRRIHDGGYVSGVYSSAGAGIRDLASRYGSRYPEPDDIWIANWDGRKTTDDPYVPDTYWSNHQRIRQYRGGHNESYHGYTINVDSNYLDGAVAGGRDSDKDGVPNDFDLCVRIDGPLENSGCPYPSHVSGGLVDYLDSVDGDRREGDHFTTTGAVPAAYRFESNLGFLEDQQLPGTEPLYSCSANRDQFLSREEDCGGAKVLGSVGNVYAQRPPGIPTSAIYRCRNADTGELTVSYDLGCDDPASTNEGLLGFTVSVATLGRYLDSVQGDRHEGDHLVTTGGVPGAYRFRSNLGLLLTRHFAGTLPLYSCTANRDQFLSRAADCGGAKVLGLVGYAYEQSPKGLPAHAIYRCRTGDTGELTVSYEPDCGGGSSTNEGRLGFTISIASLGRYLDSVDGDRREGDHFTTSAGVRAPYHFQGNLGFLFTQHVAGTAALYSCRTKRDQFLSREPGCEGAKRSKLLAWIYSSSPQGTPSHAIYRCRRKNGERFTSAQPTCGRPGNTSEGRLGYVTVSPLAG